MDNSKATTTKRINRILKDLSGTHMDRDLMSEQLLDFLDGLEKMRDGKVQPKIKPLALYLDVIDMIRSQTGLSSMLPSLMHNAEVLYDNLFLFGENTPDFEKTVEIFMLLAGEEGLASKGFFDPYLFASFTDKKYYLTLIQMIFGQKQALRIYEGIRKHALEARQYLLDDTAYLSYLLRLVSKLSQKSPDAFDAIMAEELSKIERSNGIYDIDPVRLARVEKNVQSAELTVEKGKNILEMIERKSRELERVTQELSDKAKETVRAAESYLDAKAENAKGSLDETLKEYTENQKKAIHLEKEVFLKQLFSDAETEMGKYKTMAKSITATASAEIASLGRDADGVIERLKNATSADERLMEFSKRTQQDEELLDKIEKLSVLNNAMIERFGEEMSRMPGPGMEREAGMVPGPGPGSEPGVPPLPGMPPMAPPPRTSRGQMRPIPTVNPLLDRNMPFRERFAIVQKEKQRRINAGELFHEMFDDVITAVMEDVNPYLIGPSGCGKTYMVRQIGEILNVDLSDIGYINEEYDILGYVTAMGEYSESNFYWLYKYGGIAFCDELDNGNSKATVKLNSFLTNQQRSSYCFPGGERVEKHPNFRVIAAGNTDGSGADLNYNTRERIEESVQQRMIPIYVDYDNRVEQAILKDYPDWFEFACAFREATDRWGVVCGIPAQGIFTTRDAYRIKQYLDNGSFTPEKIVNYEFIQTKEPEYLGFLKDDLAQRVKQSSGALGIYQLFAAEVDRVRNRGKRG